MTGEDSKLVHRRKRPKVDTLFSTLFFRRVRATSMTQRRVENTRVHFKDATKSNPFTTGMTQFWTSTKKSGDHGNGTLLDQC